MEDFLSKYYAEQAKAKAEGKKFLLGLIPRLKETGVGYIVGFFEGSGDSGQVEEVMCFPAGVDVHDLRGSWDAPDRKVDLPRGIDKEELDRAIDNLTPPGFEINEGGFGAIILDVEEGKVQLNYSQRVEQTVDADEEL